MDLDGVAGNCAVFNDQRMAQYSQRHAQQKSCEPHLAQPDDAGIIVVNDLSSSLLRLPKVSLYLRYVRDSQTCTSAQVGKSSIKYATVSVGGHSLIS